MYFVCNIEYGWVHAWLEYDHEWPSADLTSAKGRSDGSKGGYNKGDDWSQTWVLRSRVFEAYYQVQFVFHLTLAPCCPRIQVKSWRGSDYSIITPYRRSMVKSHLGSLMEARALELLGVSSSPGSASQLAEDGCTSRMLTCFFSRVVSTDMLRNITSRLQRASM